MAISIRFDSNNMFSLISILSMHVKHSCWHNISYRLQFDEWKCHCAKPR